MPIAAIVLFVGVLIFAAHLFAWVFSFTKIPDVLLLIGVGLVLGPWLGIITPDFFGEAGGLFSIVVLAVILFEGALDLRLDVIRESWGGAMLLVVFSFLITVILIAGVLVWLTPLPLLLTLLTASILGGTSSAIVIPLIENLGLGASSKAMLLLESALSDVLSIVVSIALLTAFQLGRFNVGSVSLDIVSSFLGAGIIGIVGGFIWSVLLNRVRHMRNSIFSTPAFVFILFGLTELFELSGPIAALAFGITVGNIVFFKIYLERHHSFLHLILHPVTLSERERSFFNEVVFLLQTFFFVFVGLSITFGNRAVLMIGGIVTVLVFLARIFVVRWSTPRDVPLFERSIMAVLVPKGLAAAVLATLVAQSGIAGAQLIQEIVYIVILFSIVFASLLMFLLYKTGLRTFYEKLLVRPRDVSSRQSSPNLAK